MQIYDYIDVHVAMLERMYTKRVKGYSAIGYSAKCEGVLPPDGNIIFDSSSFLPVFTADMLSAKREVIIVSPLVIKNRVLKMLDVLKSAMSSGAELTVVTKTVEDYLDKDKGRVLYILQLLSNNNISVIQKSKIHQNLRLLIEELFGMGA